MSENKPIKKVTSMYLSLFMPFSLCKTFVILICFLFILNESLYSYLTRLSSNFLCIGEYISLNDTVLPCLYHLPKSLFKLLTTHHCSLLGCHLVVIHIIFPNQLPIRPELIPISEVIHTTSRYGLGNSQKAIFYLSSLRVNYKVAD